MRTLEDLEIGLMFWAKPDAAETLSEVRKFGVSCGQIGIGGDLPLDGQAEAWTRVIEQAKDFVPTTVVVSFTGEDYADMPTVMNTVGFLPKATRAERAERFKKVADFAAAVQVKIIACHIGFVPEDPEDPAYGELRTLVRDLCDHCAKQNLIFALETGQEPAKVLETFILDVDRANLRINFDPANLILYGTGNPVEALDVLGKYVVSVHCKDGDWPPVEQADALGKERRLGDGSVGFPAILSKLKEIGYRGALIIEREEQDQQQRKSDITHGVELLRGLLQPSEARAAR